MFSSAGGVYCKYCILFGATCKEKNYFKLDKLVKLPITFWTSASSKLHEHDTKSDVHRSATVVANEGKQKSVGEQLDSVLSASVQKNRQNPRRKQGFQYYCR